MLATARDNGVPVLLQHLRQRFFISIAAKFLPRLMLFQFPKAYAAHYSHCSSFPSKSKLEGTTQLIEPQQGDIVRSGSYWIACLFTSEHFGRRKKNPVSHRMMEDY